MSIGLGKVIPMLGVIITNLTVSVLLSLLLLLTLILNPGFGLHESNLIISNSDAIDTSGNISKRLRGTDQGELLGQANVTLTQRQQNWSIS
jgi:hypothetical protein